MHNDAVFLYNFKGMIWNLKQMRHCKTLSFDVCSNAYYDKQLGNKALKRSTLLRLNKFKSFIFISTLHAFFPDDGKIIHVW